MEVLSWITKFIGGGGAGRKEFEEAFVPGETVRNVLARFSSRYPELDAALWDASKKGLGEHIEVMVNDAVLGLTHTLDSRLDAGDRITLLGQYMGGGPTVSAPVRRLLGFALIFFLPAASFAQATRPPVKIGLIMPYTGTLSVIGQDTTRGIEVALSHIEGKAAGREIQVIKEDTEAKPAKNTPYRKVIVMASDFVAGRHSVEAFMAGFKAAGGEIAKEVYAPLGTADYGPFLAQATGAQADAVYAWFAGADSIRFVKQYHDVGLARRFALLGYNTLVDDIVLPAIGDAAPGVVSVGHYSATLDRPVNRAFVADYERRYGGAWPTRYSELGYASAQLSVAAIESLRGELGDKARLRDALRTAIARIRPPRGPVQFDAYQQVITTVYVMRVDRRGSCLVNAIVDRIPDVSQEATWKWWQR